MNDYTHGVWEAVSATPTTPATINVKVEGGRSETAAIFYQPMVELRAGTPLTEEPTFLTIGALVKQHGESGDWTYQLSRQTTKRRLYTNYDDGYYEILSWRPVHDVFSSTMLMLRHYTADEFAPTHMVLVGHEHLCHFSTAPLVTVSPQYALLGDGNENARRAAALMTIAQGIPTDWLEALAAEGVPGNLHKLFKNIRALLAIVSGRDIVSLSATASRLLSKLYKETDER